MENCSTFYDTAEVLATVLESDDEEIQLTDSGTSNDEFQVDVLGGDGVSLCFNEKNKIFPRVEPAERQKFLYCMSDEEVFVNNY